MTTTHNAKAALDELIECFEDDHDKMTLGDWRHLALKSLPYLKQAASDDMRLPELLSSLSHKDLRKIRASLGAMIIQEKQALWAGWWGRFCNIMEPAISKEITRRAAEEAAENAISKITGE